MAVSKRTHAHSARLALRRDAAVKLGAATRNRPVSTARVRPDVWRTALRLAGGDPGRIKVISPTEVLVTNGAR